ncbi:MAG: SAP domain-containing protein [Candidatus Thermoplasmatota archaeon]|nr:SAP domain-containing protein [Candidatus Thermoplasmatota archaeon]
MAKSAKSRLAARKQRDKWRSKRWFTVRAPRNPWSYRNIGETLAEEDSMLTGRVYEIMQNELDGDFSKMHVKVKFQITHAIGSDAITEFIGHEVAKDHIRRQVRRARSKVDDTVDVVTEDGFYIRIKPIIITHRTAKSSQKQEMRARTRDAILKMGATSTWVSIQKSIMDGSMENAIKDSISSIHPVRAVMLRKSQLIQSGVTVDDGPTLEEIRENESTQDDESYGEEDAVSDDDYAIDSESITASVENDPDTPPSAEANEGDKTPTDYESMTVVQLKELLKSAGKPVSGKKAELISRLLE